VVESERFEDEARPPTKSRTPVGLQPLARTAGLQFSYHPFSIQRDIGRYLLSACSDDTRHA
jgi:hypothetical protein